MSALTSGNIHLEKRVARDQQNAELSSQLALEELARFRAPLTLGSNLHGVSQHEQSRFDYAEKRHAALEAIAADPFQVMVEVYTEVTDAKGKLQEKEQL